MAGLVTALGTLGVDVSALVAGLGLTGFALGFAVKDTISNILAGVLLLVYRPFSKKDYVEDSMDLDATSHGFRGPGNRGT